MTLSIAAVERDTGLSKDTLRVWERRYGFPQPGRDAFGERTYPMDQVDKLRVIRRLMDAGHRPGKIIPLSIEQLQAMSEATVPEPRRFAGSQALTEPLDHYIELVKSHQIEELRRSLSQALLRVGLARFVTDIISPLTQMVGDAWARGYLEIFEEHLYTESVQVILRNAINTIPQPGKRPRILLTTFPQEPHGLGLLMAEALLALDGGRCISLGTQTPIWDIVLAATSQNCDIVALSFSACLNPNAVIEGLEDLRAKLPGQMEIWAGGSCPILTRKPPKDVRVFSDLQQIHGALVDWRASHAAAGE
ncbi:MAG TPA: MerR family transcriptional regulator [Burkholderiaceae bacterium]|nr:MerR family transcriptional regulator [Burkholderiaceae bacterium]